MRMVACVAWPGGLGLVKPVMDLLGTTRDDDMNSVVSRSVGEG